MSIVKKHIFIFAFLFAVSGAWGQAARSPFTTFGIGEPYRSALINTQGMAGVGVSQPQYRHLNNQNPALLTYNNLTVFQAGVIGERRTIRGDTLSERSTGGNLNYLATAFPIIPGRWTTSVGLMPYTSVRYQLRYTDDILNTSGEKVNITEEGSGGISQVYWSNGVRVAKGLALGVKASYLFSSIVTTYKNQLAQSGQPVNYLSAIEEKSHVKDFTFGVGISYSLDSLFSRKRYRLSFGAVYDFAADLNTKKTDKLFRTTALGDTIQSMILPTSGKGSIFVPPALTAGVSFGRDFKWNIGAEFSYQDWSTFKSINRKDEGLGESWRIALGYEVIPDIFDPESYLKQVTYRFGVSAEQYPFLVENNTVRDYGVSLGLSLPAGDSSIDLAFKAGRRGNRDTNLLEEDYFKVYIGITFNDRWFIRRRFD